MCIRDRSMYCMKVVQEIGYRELVYAVSGIFLLPVWPKRAVGGLFLPFARNVRIAFLFVANHIE